MSYLSYCGMLCEECPIYIATKNNDMQAKEKLAKECSNKEIVFTAEDMTCEGCFWEKNDSTKMCGNCEIRNCARVKAVDNCGLCISYPCDIVERCIAKGCPNRDRLDAIAISTK